MKTMITLVLLFLSMNSFAGITRNKCDISIDGYAGPRAHSVFEGKEKSAQIGEVVAQQLINKGFNVVPSNTTESAVVTRVDFSYDRVGKYAAFTYSAVLEIKDLLSGENFVFTTTSEGISKQFDGTGVVRKVTNKLPNCDN